MKQTAIEWLFERLWDEPKDKFTWYALRKKAKEMEKEQIMDSFEDGAESLYRHNFYSEDREDSEQYYNETYGGEQ